MKKIEVIPRKSAFADLNEFCSFAIASGKKHLFVEVTEWTNIEGYDITIEGSQGKRTLSLTYGEWEAIKECINTIENHGK